MPTPYDTTIVTIEVTQERGFLEVLASVLLNAPDGATLGTTDAKELGKSLRAGLDKLPDLVQVNIGRFYENKNTHVTYVALAYSEGDVRLVSVFDATVPAIFLSHGLPQVVDGKNWQEVSVLKDK